MLFQWFLFKNFVFKHFDVFLTVESKYQIFNRHFGLSLSGSVAGLEMSHRRSSLFAKRCSRCMFSAYAGAPALWNRGIMIQVCSGFGSLSQNYIWLFWLLILQENPCAPEATYSCWAWIYQQKSVFFVLILTDVLCILFWVYLKNKTKKLPTYQENNYFSKKDEEGKNEKKKVWLKRKTNTYINKDHSKLISSHKSIKSKLHQLSKNIKTHSYRLTRFTFGVPCLFTWSCFLSGKMWFGAVFTEDRMHGRGLVREQGSL